jgi:hypothetical protein
MNVNGNGFFKGNSLFNSDLSIMECTFVNTQGMVEDCTAFNNAGSSDINNLTTALTAVKECFYDAIAFNQPVNNWNVSAVTDFQQIFRNCEAFNQDMEDWDVSSAETMNGIFREADVFNNGGVGGVGVGLDTWSFPLNTTLAYAFLFSDFNQYIGSWNVSSVTDMSACFRGTPFNNGDAAGVSGGGVGIGMDNWDVSSVGGFGSIFEGAPFNQYIGSWNIGPYLVQSTNTSTATNKLIDTTQDFVAAGVTTSYFVRNEATLENAQVVSVATTEITFSTDIFPSSGVSYSIFRRVSFYGFVYNQAYFNQDISNWRMDNVISTYRMFSKTNHAFNCGGVGGTVGTGIDKWRFKMPCDFREMFNGCSSMNQYMNSWDTSLVTKWDQFLYRCSSFNKPVNNWSFAGCTTSATFLFRGCTVFNQPVDGGTGWGETMSGITGFFYAFNECDAWNQPMTVNWTGIRGDTTGVMSGCNVMNGGQASGIRSRDVRIKFPAFASGASFSVSSGWSSSAAWNQDMESDGTYWDVSCFTGMSQAFNNTKTNQDLSSWELKNVTNMTTCFGTSQIISFYNICKTLPGWVTNVPNTGCNATIIFNNRTISKTQAESTLTTGTNTSVTSLKLVDTGVNFVTLGVQVGDRVNNTTNGEYAEVTAVAATELDLDFDAFTATPQNYAIIQGYDGMAGYDAYIKLSAPTPASFSLSGTNASGGTNQLNDTGTDFVAAGVLEGMLVKNTTSGQSTRVAAVATNTLTLDDDYFSSGSQAYTIEGGYGWTLTTGLDWT